MKYGIHAGLWMKKWDDDLCPILQNAAKIGFDGVEASLLGVDRTRANEYRELARDLGLELTCSTGLGRDADPTSSDPDMRLRAENVLRLAIETAEALGSSQIAGVIFAPWGDFDPQRKSDRLAWSADTLGRLDQPLSDSGICLGIEAINRFETDLVNTAEEARALALATGSAHIGVLLDTFHMNIEEKDSSAAIVSTGEYLKHFHVSDNDRGVPGNGQYDFESAANALRAIGYEGWVTAEMFVMAGSPASADLNIWRNIEADPDTAARQTLSYLKNVFSDAR